MTEDRLRVAILWVVASAGLGWSAHAQGLQTQCRSQLIELSSPGLSAAEVCSRFDQGDFVIQQGADGTTCYICPVEDYISAAAPAPVPGIYYLSDVASSYIDSGNLEQGLRLNDCWDFPGIAPAPTPIAIDGIPFAKGLGLHPLNSAVEGFASFEVPPGATWFRAYVGFCDDHRPPPANLCATRLSGQANANFAALVDTRIAKLGPVNEVGQLLEVRVAGATTLTLTVDRGENGNYCDWVMFADARFE